jgi:hypothetical protein
VTRMKEQIIHLTAQWKADLVIVEDTSTGMGLLQLLREQPILSVIGRQPSVDRETRMCRHPGRIRGGAHLAAEGASRLADFESEPPAFSERSL